MSTSMEQDVQAMAAVSAHHYDIERGASDKRGTSMPEDEESFPQVWSLLCHNHFRVDFSHTKPTPSSVTHTHIHIQYVNVNTIQLYLSPREFPHRTSIGWTLDGRGSNKQALKCTR